MLCPSVCRHSRRLKQNAKKLVLCPKNKKLLSTSRLGNSQNKNKVLKNFVHDQSLSGIHNSKLKFSVHLSRAQKLHNESHAVSSQQKASKSHSHSETTLKNSIPQPRRKSESMRLLEGEASLKPRNGARRVTRSSFGSVPNSPSKKKVQKPAQNRKKGRKTGKSAATRIDKKITTFRQSLEKSIAVNLTVIEKEVVVPEELKRATRSSFGSVTGLCSLRNRTPQSKSVAEHGQLSSKIPNKSKQKSQKNERVIIKDSKRATHSSFGRVTGLCSLRNQTPKSKQKSQKNERVVINDSKRVKRSSFGSKTSFTSSQNGSAGKCIKSKSIVVSKDSCINTKASKKVIRSSIGSETGSTSSPIQSAAKRIKSKPVVKKKDSDAIIKVSRKRTRSSLGSVTSSTSMRNKNSEDKLSSSPAVQSSGSQVKLKQTVKEKDPISAEDSKRMTRSSFESATSTSVSLRNRSPIQKNVKPPLQQERHAKKQAKTKNMTKGKNPDTVIKRTRRLTNSSLEDVSSSSSIVEETPKCKLMESPLLQSAPNSNGYKQTGKETSGIKEDPKHKKHSGSSDLSSVLEPANDKVEKSRKRKVSNKSTNTRKKTLSATIKLTPVSPIGETRNKRSSSHSGSLSVLEKEKRNSGNSKISRGGKGKAKVSPSVEGKRKIETNMPIRVGGKRKREISLSVPSSMVDPISSMDCLTKKSLNKKPRRHTVNVTLGTKSEKKLSTTQQKSRKKSSTKSQRSSATPKSASSSRNKLSSTLTPDISLLPIDSISTFMSNRPNSAPAEIFKQSLVKGLNSSIPKKGTLKRKRWLLNALKEKNESYEDDIFENKKFGTPLRLPTEPDEESDSSIATPKFGFLLTPALPKKTPKYKDCISPSDLLIARKCAEEYQFRRQNRKRTSNKVITLKTPSSAQSEVSTSFDHVPEKKKLNFIEAMDKAKTIQNGIIQKLTEDEGEEEDHYFSDVST